MGRPAQPELEHRNTIIAARYLDGEPIESLAEAYGLKPRSVANLMQRMKVSRNATKDERNEKIRAAYAGGKTTRELAQTFGIGHAWVVRIAISKGKVPRYGTGPMDSTR